MYYVQKDNIVVLSDENKDKILTTLKHKPEYQGFEILEVPDGYVAIVGRELITKENYEAEQQQAERERLNNLSMTRGDVFEALILAKGLGKAQIRAMIEQAELDTVTKALYLNRFDEALEFYRGYPIFDMLGEALDITGAMLDRFFDTKDYHYLTKCELAINTTPTEAKVTGAGSYPYGTTAHYKVECEGYIPIEGDIEMLENKVLEVVLDEDTTNTEPNVPDEVETEETTESNVD